MTLRNRKVARVFLPLLQPARYKGAYGGRGSGKSHFFAEQLIADSLEHKGLLSVCLREVQQTLKQSSKRLIEKKIQDLGVGHEFRVFYDRIETPGDGCIAFMGMADHTAESIKSLEGFKRAWFEEAQTASNRSVALLRPTIRAEGSEIWAGWNPRRKTDAFDALLRAGVKSLKSATVVQANWRDNPWFNDVLNEERLTDLDLYPDRYDHIWEGGYAKAMEGAYFAKELALAKAQKRITRISADPMLPLRAIFDLGGSGATADAMSIWIVQYVAKTILVVDYLEGVGQTLSYYVAEMKKRGYGKAICVLPHDGVNAADNLWTGKRYKDHLDDAGFETKIVKNQGKGAAMMRIEAARRLFPRVWFNEVTTEAGRDALGFYHEKKDPARDVGLGPDHDWSSHAADAFGLMCVEYEEPTKPGEDRLNIPSFGSV